MGLAILCVVVNRLSIFSSKLTLNIDSRVNRSSIFKALSMTAPINRNQYSNSIDENLLFTGTRLINFRVKPGFVVLTCELQAALLCIRRQRTYNNARSMRAVALTENERQMGSRVKNSIYGH